VLGARWVIGGLLLVAAIVAVAIPDPLTIVLLSIALLAFVVPHLPNVAARRRGVAADSED